MKDPNGRLAQWALKLQHHDFTIKHQAGAIHQNADGLSRLPPIAFLGPEDDPLSNLLRRPSIWHLDPPKVQTSLKDISSFTQIKVGILYKQVNPHGYRTSFFPLAPMPLWRDTQIVHGSVRKM